MSEKNDPFLLTHHPLKTIPAISPNDILYYIFVNENVWISIKISLKFVPKGQISNNPALIQILAWRQPGEKPLSALMVVRLPTHIYVTRAQCDIYLSALANVKGLKWYDENRNRRTSIEIFKYRQITRIVSHV